MKPYGVKKKDFPFDCTAIGKFGVTKLPNRCCCGIKHSRPSKDNKSRKAKMRRMLTLYLTNKEYENN